MSRRAGTQKFGSPGSVISGLARMMELALTEVDLTLAQYRIIGFCAMDPANPSELAAWLSVPQQNLTRQIDSLVDLGLLQRATDPTDRRRVVLTVTQAGSARIESAEREIDRYLDLILKKLDPVDATRFREGLALAGVSMSRAWDLAIERPELQPGATTARRNRTDSSR